MSHETRQAITTSMNKLIFIPFLTLSPFFFAAGQSYPETYKFTEDIRKDMERDTTAWKYQVGATNYAFAGDYLNALKAWDEGFKPRNYIPTSQDSVTLQNAVFKHATDYIIERSVNEQIIIINEAHHNPKHRVFTRSLLEGLYTNGYRYLGLEALTDSIINERGYAVSESGYYTGEPEFGNLIYEAKKLGFTIFGYEAAPGKNGKEREIEQATNIRQFMETNREGKMLIHCGFDHVYEKEVSSWGKAMAGRLKEYTGIDPLTIDQVKFTERSKPEFSHYFLSAAHHKNPFIMTNPEATVFNGFGISNQTDLVVLHPVTTYRNGWPDWSTTGRKEYWLPQRKRKKYPGTVQVLVYRPGEYENMGIPVTITELQPGINKPLYLQCNHYTVIIRNKEYVVIDRFSVVVK